ncbi:hypothetical protein FHS68_002175 [Dyadobacter arcticus]|uniref:Glyoxalase/fosfomycin resistance/dioxygenase domain-containing protein n=1 Tax=Dyadobacter arcticus TaxID=1078754 RepID=A0ABX0UMV4_9BACT|nr:hypothetical protein [Dyadobacter arcticus]
METIDNWVVKDIHAAVDFFSKSLGTTACLHSKKRVCM